jgi:hypothetical protein
MKARYPTDRQTVAALRVVGAALGQSAAYWHEGRFWFPLSETWALAISPDSAGRFRMEACYGTTEVARLWVLPGDRGRMARLAASLKVETLVHDDQVG